MTRQVIRTVQEGIPVTIDYILHLDNGQVAQLPGAPSPATFVVGDVQMLKALEDAILGLKEGDFCDLTLEVDRAFGPLNPRRVIPLKRALFSAERELLVGQRVRLHNKSGRVRRGRVVALSDTEVQVDFNHPLANHTLIFDLRIRKVGPA